LQFVQEILHPSLAIRSVSASRRNEEVALVLEGVKVLPPELGRIAGVDISLTSLVGLIETHSTVSVTRLDQLGEITNLLGTPQHGAAFHANGVGFVNTPRAPGIVFRNLRGLEVLDGGVITQGPSKAYLGATGART